jgi:hypothetical protein
MSLVNPPDINPTIYTHTAAEATKLAYMTNRILNNMEKDLIFS